ncbi:MAG: glycosyltransferase, partial [Sphingomicrobium sp.]
IEIALRSGMKLKMAAKVDHADRAYFDKEIAPLLDDPSIEFIGEIGDSDKPEFLGNARALVFPIDWPEPFGLVMIEAMAAGTPIIAWATGSTPEVIDHGRSGFLVSSIEQAVDAVAACGELPRQTVRDCFEQRFTARRMAEDYLRLFSGSTMQDRTQFREPFMLAS